MRKSVIIALALVTGFLSGCSANYTDPNDRMPPAIITDAKPAVKPVEVSNSGYGWWNYHQTPSEQDDLLSKLEYVLDKVDRYQWKVERWLDDF